MLGQNYMFPDEPDKPVSAVNHDAAPGAVPSSSSKIPQAEAVSGKKAVRGKAKAVTVKQSKGMKTHE